MSITSIHPADHILIRAIDALIDKTLREADQDFPSKPAARLIYEMRCAGLASDTEAMTDEGPIRTLTIAGISARSSAGSLGRLRNWQGVARATLSCAVGI